MLNRVGSYFGKSLEVIHLKGLSFEELKKEVENLQEDMRHYEQENEIFENFLMANESSLISEMDTILERAQQVREQSRMSFSGMQTQSNVTSSGSTMTFKSPQRFSGALATAKGPRINLSQKTDLVLREIDEIQNSFEKFIKRAKRLKFNLRAEIEELQIRSKEVQEAYDTFEQFIVVASVNKHTQKIPAEKFVRYMQDWLKNGQIILEKMRLHSLSYKIQLAKLKSQKIQKGELGESVDEADLEKLQIQKVHMISEIRQKNENLLELKHMNSKANMLLIAHKKILEKQQETRTHMRAALEDTESKVQILEMEAEQSQREVEYERKRMEDLKKMLQLYEAPSVLDYIRKKAELYELKKELKIWRRRQTVQETGLTTYTKMMCQLKGVKKSNPLWYCLRGQRDMEMMQWSDEGGLLSESASSLSQ